MRYFTNWRSMTFPSQSMVRLASSRDATSELIPGEPVMMTVNDYNRKIFNGDQGLVVNVSERDRLTRWPYSPKPRFCCISCRVAPSSPPAFVRHDCPQGSGL